MDRSFASTFRLLRRGSGWSLKKTARQLGVSLNTVSRWERGESYPRLRSLVKIAKLFEVSIWDLVEQR